VLHGLNGKANAPGESRRLSPVPTPTRDALPRRFADFDTLEKRSIMLRAASAGSLPRSARQLSRAYFVSRAAPGCADRSLPADRRGIRPGERVALVAETGAEFAALFFGVIYAGAWPVPLPLPTSFGGRDSYIDQLVVQLKARIPSCSSTPPNCSAGRRAAQAAASRVRLGNLPSASATAPTAPRPTTSPICNIRASRRAFPHGRRGTPTARLLNQSRPRTATHEKCDEQRPLRLLAALES
jgi:fatty-acyl-CoA synthase